VLRVDLARWNQTPADLRRLSLSASHPRTRERALALFDIAQEVCATQVALRTGRRAQTVMGLPTRSQAPNVTCLVLTLERSAMLTWSKTLRAGARRRGHS